MTNGEDTNSEAEALRAKLREIELELLRARDRAIALNLELVQLRDDHLVTEMKAELASIRSSVSYKVGHLVTAPVRAGFTISQFIRRAFRRLFGKLRGLVNKGHA
jgi:hypothetical protein